MDNPATEPSDSTLAPDDAARLLAGMLDTDPVAETDPQPTAEAPAEQEQPAEAGAEDDPVVTVKIDGKDVEVKLSELKNGYQRQADYTRKTMEVSEQRKAAEAEAAKARQERQAYGANLAQIEAQLRGVLQEQQESVKWDELLTSDPMEYLKQRHLAEARHAKLQQVAAERARVQAQEQAEAQEAQRRYLESQHQALLDKLPEWRDAKKADAERAAIRDFLMREGFDAEALNQVTDARAVVLARKAMLYDQMMSKAKAAAKKVATLPQKVERPGVAQEAPGLDRRTSAYQRLAKSGKVEDAAALFASIL